MDANGLPPHPLEEFLHDGEDNPFEYAVKFMRPDGTTLNQFPMCRHMVAAIYVSRVARDTVHEFMDELTMKGKQTIIGKYYVIKITKT